MHHTCGRHAAWLAHVLGEWLPRETTLGDPSIRHEEPAMPQHNSKFKNRPAVWIVFRMVLIQTEYVSYRSATLTNAIFLSPSTPSSEKDPPRFNKSLSFSTETGILSSSSCPGTRTETGSRFQKKCTKNSRQHTSKTWSGSETRRQQDIPITCIVKQQHRKSERL